MLRVAFPQAMAAMFPDYPLAPKGHCKAVVGPLPPNRGLNSGQSRALDWLGSRALTAEDYADCR
eukprot:15061637-Alexandrium_andersonii.AAC.1